MTGIHRSIGLTSAAFVDGGTIPVRYACAGANLSVPLAWSAIPTAQSYAVVMTDATNNLLHWVIWDIPSSTLSLPEGTAKLAQPPIPASASPCPPVMHVYRFELFGLEVATRPGVTTTSTRAQVKTAIAAHATSGTQALEGSYAPKGGVEASPLDVPQPCRGLQRHQGARLIGQRRLVGEVNIDPRALSREQLDQP